MKVKDIQQDLQSKERYGDDTYLSYIDFFIQKIIFKSLIPLLIGTFLLSSVFMFDGRVSLLVQETTGSFFEFLLACYILLLVAMAVFSWMKITNKPLLFKDVSMKENAKKYHRMYQFADIGSFAIMTVSLIFLFILFVLTTSRVVGVSMEPNYYGGDRLLVWHLGYEPKHDDAIVIFMRENAYSNADNDFYIKRVIALPGDEIQYQDQHLVVNGREVASMTLTQFERFCSSGKDAVNRCIDGVLDPGFIGVLGDNRDASNDSRNFGLIYEEDVIGKAVFRFFPFSRFGLIEGTTS